MARRVPPLAAGADAQPAIDLIGRFLSDRRLEYVSAPVLVATAALVVELQLAGLGHATHLLLFLLMGAAFAIRVGPGPAAAALAAGAVGSAVASVAGLGPTDPIMNALAQLSLYGLAAVALLAAMARPRDTFVGSAPAARGSSPPTVTLEHLTERELEILRLAAAGRQTEEIAALLVVSPNTVKTHLSHAYQKLGARNRSEAIRVAIHCGCISTSDICPHLGGAPDDLVRTGDANHPKG